MKLFMTRISDLLGFCFQKKKKLNETQKTCNYFVPFYNSSVKTPGGAWIIYPYGKNVV